MRGHYRNDILRRSKVAVAAAVTSPSQVDAPTVGPVTSPAQLDDRQRPARAAADQLYQRDLNQETDLLFWSETGYKPHQRLNPRDPNDQRMIATWLATRDRVARSWSPQQLRQNVAIRAAFDTNKQSGLPYYVYSRGGPSSEALMPFADQNHAFAYAHARIADSGYVAYFAVDDPHWPKPAFENV